MTLHLSWMTPVWVLAALGAGVVLWFIIGAVLMILFFRD